MGGTLMAHLPRLFRTHSGVPNKKNPIAVFRIFPGDFLFYIDKVCCVFSLESPR